ncbi:MAG: hypothetical protein QM477_10735 [Planctomycetota bacterium]
MFNPLIFFPLALVFSGATLGSMPTTVETTAIGPRDDAQHEDEKLGFKMTTPKKWNQIPIQNNERWIVGRYQSNKSNHYTDETFGWTYNHKPEMTMIAFTGESMKTDIDLDLGGKDKGKTISTTLRLENPYKDYEEYLRKTYRDGGWYVDSEESLEIRGVKVTAFSIKVEKSSRLGPKRITTWVYHLGHADVAVQFECLEGAYDKWKKEFSARFRSFKVIERTKASDASSQSLRELFNAGDTPEERREVRISIEQDQHRKALANLPEEWTADDSGRFLVLSHVKKKDTKQVVKQVDLMFAWLEENFPFVGEGEYVRRPIIRICKNSEEMGMFVSGSGWSFTNIEILTCKDNSSMGDYYSGQVNDRSFRYWFYERDRELYSRIPAWFRYGMDSMLHTAEVKGNKLIFEPDNWAKTGLRDALKDETITLPSEMFKMTSSDFRGKDTIWREFGAFVRYLMVGKGAKSKLTKNLAEEYLGHLKDILDEEEALSDAGDDMEDDGPTTEEEEDEAFKNNQNVWKERAESIANEVYQRTFSDWTQKDWDKLDADYLRTIK